MDTHRIRSAKSTDNKTRSHIFVEVEPDRWLETLPVINHGSIHAMLAKEKETQTFHIGFAERAFHIGLIRNWFEAGYVC